MQDMHCEAAGQYRSLSLPNFSWCSVAASLDVYPSTDDLDQEAVLQPARRHSS